MFIDFFFELKSRGVPVSLTEWIVLHKVLSENLNLTSLDRFYYIARAVLVKDEALYDKYDIAFASYFKGIETPEEMVAEILKGLERIDALVLTPEQMALLEALDLDEVRANFERQWGEGRYKGHKGGNRAIGTGGTSTQGAYGFHPTGVRIGQDGSRHRRAVQIAEERRFKNYSSEVILDTRNIKVALSRLRTLLPRGPEDELDLDKTIDKTCRNGGEIDLVWGRSLTNAAKVLLFMDSGGSMNPFVQTVERLFSAAKSQIRDLRYFYFHNCIYQEMYSDFMKREKAKTIDVLRQYGSDYRAILVGDADMAPSELLNVDGAIYYYYRNDTPGIHWLKMVKDHFRKCVWLNPRPARIWPHTDTIPIVKEVFPMYEMTLEGITDAVKYLMR
ncbi:MAG: VWA domain-containing protein [Deltaproteobacteria bacterium]|uniref:VWA domain-containing protein n=1 Tax=Candidatus Zymogenus saltonus TaxID=2844893 RepID=A0A9D8KH89_9DELT|nr:VWA domain-containing protein [Candidatus Zymogenus saltonus]